MNRPLYPTFKPAGGYILSVRPTGSEGMPDAILSMSLGTFDARAYLSVAELREFCRTGLALADEIEPEKPKPPSRPPSMAELRSAFGAGFVGGPGIIGRRPEDRP